MERVETITFHVYFTQVGGASLCAVAITYAVLTVRGALYTQVMSVLFIKLFPFLDSLSTVYIPSMRITHRNILRCVCQ